MPESVVSINGHLYRYEYREGRTIYLGPVGEAPALSEQDFVEFLRLSRESEGEVREKIQQLIDSRGFSGNIYIDTDDVGFVLRRWAPKDHPKELHMVNITVYEEGTGTWKELWPAILDVVEKNDYDRIKVELVYNERWREWFERPGSGWEKVLEGAGQKTPSYWYSTGQ
jgi:hypothetical protein